MQDADWIADLLQHGLLTASFVPSQEQQDLRDLTRLRVNLVQERTRLANRVHKVLDAAGCQLSAVLSDILGFSGKRILQALCAGESDPVHLARLMHPGVKATEEQVIAALTTEVREHHRFLLRELLELIEVQDRSISRLEVEIERHLSPCEEEMERCEHINGVSRQVLYVLMAEIGTDLERFPDASHLSRLRWGLSRTKGERRKTAQWTGEKRQSVCASGFSPSGPWRSSLAYLPGGAVSSAQKTARE